MTSRKIVSGIFVALLSVSGPCSASPSRVALDKDLCRPAPSALLNQLPGEWREYGKYSQLCPVLGKGKKAILYVLTHRLDLAGADIKFMTNVNRFGHGISDTSLILDMHYRIIGIFIGDFPYTMPDMLYVTFTDWRDNFPYRAEFFIPAGDIHDSMKFSLYWNPSAGKFQDRPP